MHRICLRDLKVSFYNVQSMKILKAERNPSGVKMKNLMVMNLKLFEEGGAGGTGGV